MQQQASASSLLVMKEHPVLTGLRWILDPKNRQQPGGRKWSMRALSVAAGLAPSHVEGIINGRQAANITSDTAQALARAGNVRTLWLLSGQGPREPFEGEAVESPVPPPASETRLSGDAINDVLNEAWDSTRHVPSDALLVGEALRSQAALLKGHVSPLDIVRALLDTAADARQKGKVISAEDLPLAALGSTKRQLASAEEKIARMLAGAALDAEAMGLYVPPGGHPLLLAEQKRAFGSDFEDDGEGPVPPKKGAGGKG